LRERLEEAVGEEYRALAALMGELRGEVMAAFSKQLERAEAWGRLLDSDVLELLARGETGEAREHARRAMGIAR
jgi:siroheme synthase (precorrin-2 oxidase/ferrochelatase)